MKAEPIQDGWVLHGLKEMPGWVICFSLILVFLTVWQFTHDDYIPRIIDGLVAALLLSIRTGARNNTIKTDELNTESMDSANITAETVTTDKKPK